VLATDTFPSDIVGFWLNEYTIPLSVIVLFLSLVTFPYVVAVVEVMLEQGLTVETDGTAAANTFLPVSSNTKKSKGTKIFLV
jgi:hypothetical protein